MLGRAFLKKKNDINRIHTRVAISSQGPKKKLKKKNNV